MYLVKDVRYDNRWVEFEDWIVKFENQLADVPDRHIDYFKKNPEFVIEKQVFEDDPLPKAKKKK